MFKNQLTLVLAIINKAASSQLQKQDLFGQILCFIENIFMYCKKIHISLKVLQVTKRQLDDFMV
ncbi:hypothetical protein pb186bvf_014663 [Paramecium bursaria]